MEKRRMTILAVVGLISVLLMAAGPWVLALVEYRLPWYVIGGGGGGSASSNYAIDGTIGQAVVGSSSGGSYELGGGFWYGFMEGPAPTNTPTGTTSPTATPTATATRTSTVMPTPTRTATTTLVSHRVYLPLVLRQ